MNDPTVALLWGLALSVLVRELLDNSGYVAERLIHVAIQRLPEAQRARMTAEWEGELEYLRPRRGKLRVIEWALRVYFRSAEQARELGRPMVVTEGTIGIYWDGSGGAFSLSGPDLSIGVANGLHLMLAAGRDLTVGTVVDVSETHFAGGRGAALVNGIAYTTPDLIWFSGPLRIEAEPFLVTDQGATGTFKTSFRLTGSISGSAEYGPAAKPLFTAAIAGRGSLTLRLRRHPGANGPVRYCAFGTGHESLEFVSPCSKERWYDVWRRRFAWMIS